VETGAIKAVPGVPDGHAVYAIGDIHARLDLLEELEGEIVADAARRGAERRTVIYLGDYISRGPSSYGVIEHMLAPPLPGFERVCLKGNHEDLLAWFLDGDLIAGKDLLNNGGIAMFEDYGVHVPDPYDDDDTLGFLRRTIAAALPPAHLAFFQGLQLSRTIGDYFFVHAGVRPGVPLAEQKPLDLMWIRRRFLMSDLDHGKIVVHGHCITPEPVVRPNHIGLDTGASQSGVLTCLALYGQERRFLQTSGPPAPSR